MILLGVTRQQAKILKMVKQGLDHKTISLKLNITEHESITDEMIAMDKLAQRWGKTEAEVKKMLSTMLLLILCLLPRPEGDDIERALRSSRLTRISRPTKRESQVLDSLLFDV